MLIAASRPRLAVKLSISKETGLRPVELLALKVKDIDLEKGILYLSTAKHGAPRALKIKTKTLNMLKAHIHQNRLSVGQRLQGASEDKPKDAILTCNLETSSLAETRHIHTVDIILELTWIENGFRNMASTQWTNDIHQYGAKVVPF